ncbi:MAG TPA: hypothetical protein VG457_18685 [Planctomycetota bacterium]|jgi:hypothetical protein|nr:hypothetical protein [Planctomycetota bacterium]
MGKQTLTIFRQEMRRRPLIPVAALLAVVLLATSPRSLLAPVHSFNQASESKRPKTPKNVVRAESHHASNGERPGKGPRPSPTQETLQQSHDVQVRIAFASPALTRAFQELTKPDYLKSYSASPPGDRLAPPT